MKLIDPRAATAPAFLALSCVSLFAAPASAAPNDAPSTNDVMAEEEVQPDEDDRRDPRTIVVTGERENELQSPRQTAPLVDTPQTVTVVSDQTIRRQNLLTLRDVLGTVPGITFGAGEGGGGYGDNINLRGFSASNDISIDGVRDTAQYGRTDPFNLQQVEVYNGANSTFGGAGSLGGNINLVSKVPQASDLTILSAGVGTDNYYRGTVDTNHRLGDTIAVRLNAMVHGNDVPGRDIESFERWGIAPSITIGLGQPTSVTLAYVHQQDDNVPIFGVPYYPAVGGPLPGVDDSDYFGIANLDRQEIELNRATIIVDHAFSEDVSLRTLGRYQHVNQPTLTSAPQGTYCLANGQTPLGVACPAGQNVPGFYYPSGPRGLVREQRFETMSAQSDLRWEAGTAGRLRNTMVFGLSWNQENYLLDTGNVLRNPGGALPNPVQPPISITNPDTIYTGPVNYVRTGLSFGETRSIAGYIFDTLEIGTRFELSGALRFENAETEFRADTYATPAAGGAVTTGATQRSSDDLFSWRAGAVFKPTTNSSLYVSAASSQTPSAVSARAGCTTNCAVEPESGRIYEIGGKLELLNRRLLLTAALFQNERSNFRVASNDPVFPSIQVVDGESRVRGIALGATGNITPRWAIFANYTYLDSEVVQSVSDFCLGTPGAAGCGNSAATPDPQRGNVLQQTPDHSASLFTTYTFPFGLQLGYGFTYQGRFAVNQSTLAAPAQFFADDYLVHRLFASYEFGRGITGQLNVQNVTDERYFTGVRNNGWATPGEGPSAVLSLYYSF